MSDISKNDLGKDIAINNGVNVDKILDKIPDENIKKELKQEFMLVMSQQVL